MPPPGLCRNRTKPWVVPDEHAEPFRCAPLGQPIRRQHRGKLTRADRVLDEQYDIDLMLPDKVLDQTVERFAIDVPE